MAASDRSPRNWCAERGALRSPTMPFLNLTKPSSGEASADYTVSLETTNAADFAAGSIFTGRVELADGQTVRIVTFDVTGELPAASDPDSVVHDHINERLLPPKAARRHSGSSPDPADDCNCVDC